MKNLSKDQLQSIIALANDLNFFGKRKRETRLSCCDQILDELEISSQDVESRDLCDYLLQNKPVKAAAAKAAKELEEIIPTMEGSLFGRDVSGLDDGVYIVTAAQNNTKPHPVFDTLKVVSADMQAELAIMPIKYTTTLQGRERKQPTFNPDLIPYMLDSTDSWIGGEGCVLLANSAQILPTAKQPINAAERLNVGESLTVVASPRRQLKTLARQKNGAHRWVYTTSVCTLKHYTDSRAGAEAEAEHCFGALRIEVKDGMISHRRLTADDNGVIIDQDTVYFPNGDIKAYSSVFDTQPVAVLGDLHCEKMCDHSFGRATDWLNNINPSLIVLHDAMDFMSRNHHNREDWTFLYSMQDRAVIDDFTDVINYLNKLAKIAPLFIVESNHDLAVDSWVRDNKYNVRKDPKNARTYYALMLAYIDAMDDGSFGDFAKMDLVFRALSDELPELSSNITFGKLDEQKITFGYEVGQHGHLGTSGARGSAMSFKKMRIKSISGHSHSPLEDNNTVVVGVTGSMEMGYNKGGTTWDRANALVYPNGTHQLVPMYSVGEHQY